MLHLFSQWKQWRGQRIKMDAINQRSLTFFRLWKEGTVGIMRERTLISFWRPDLRNVIGYWWWLNWWPKYDWEKNETSVRVWMTFHWQTLFTLSNVNMYYMHMYVYVYRTALCKHFPTPMSKIRMSHSCHAALFYLWN